MAKKKTALQIQNEATAKRKAKREKNRAESRKTAKAVGKKAKSGFGKLASWLTQPSKVKRKPKAKTPVYKSKEEPSYSKPASSVKERKTKIKKTKKTRQTSQAKHRLSKAGVKVSKETASESGKVRRGAKGAKVTKGGAYPEYKKKSRAAKSFREAFSSARKEKGAGKTFTWDGRSYSTNTADDVKKSKAAKAAKAKKDKHMMEPVIVTPKKEKKPTPKPTVHKTITADKGDTSTSAKDISKREYSYESKKNREEIQKERDYEKQRDEGFPMETQKKEDGGMIDRPQYGSSGKVEGGGLFDWPTKDSRNR